MSLAILTIARGIVNTHTSTLHSATTPVWDKVAPVEPTSVTPTNLKFKNELCQGGMKWPVSRSQ